MKRKALKYVFSVLLSIIIIACIVCYVYIGHKNKQNETELLGIADDIVSEKIIENGVEDNCIEEEVFSVEKISEDKNVLGKVIIPKIKVEAPIKEGTTANVLKESVGHFSQTNYWTGNVALASHNRGTYAHYFEKINQLDLNDEIIYKTKLGTRIYKVSNIKEISEEDFSVLNDTDENTITLITCIKNKSNMRLCVKATEQV